MKRKKPLKTMKICLAILLASLPAISAEATPINERWVAPLAGKLIVVRTFDGAAYRANHYGPAHRGVDLLAEVGDQVFAPTDGVVAYVGVINSIPIVVIAHANSRNTGGADQRLRTTYLPVESELMVGDLVRKADPIGNITSKQHFFGRTVLHWGERLSGEYKNPLRRLGAPVILPRLS
jgi:murein DD-endopeptidase MepM/ murein hydrolase activator NlpD